VALPALDVPMVRLLVELAIVSGLRSGELRARREM